MSREIVIGIDGGGSHTRALAVDLSGRCLGYIVEKGANPYHNAEAKGNIERAIHRLLQDTDRKVEDVVQLVAGLAGIDTEKDYIWAREFVELPGLLGKCTVVSDALIAQVGAFSGEPGIIAISGTGAVMYGVNEMGVALCNYDYRHYSYSAARFLAYEVVHQMIGEQFLPEDQGLVGAVLEFWGVKDLSALGVLGSKQFISDEELCNKKFGDMAPLVTEAASNGSPLARKVCNHAAYSIATGIYLAGASFKASTIPVALIGSVLTSDYMKKAVAEELGKSWNRQKVFVLKEPELSPIFGAIFIAFKELGIVFPMDFQKDISQMC